MNDLKEIIKKIMTLVLTGLVIMLFNSCQDFTEDEMIITDSAFGEELIPWNDLLNQLDSESDIAFVQNGESIQEAIDAALPGDVIYLILGEGITI